MGDAIVSSAVDRLGDFLIQEAAFLLQVKDDLVSIRDELIWMQSFLKDAQQKQGIDDRIRLWIFEITSIAFKTEDIIDTFYTKVKGEKPSKRRQLIASLRKYFNTAGESNDYDLANEIKAIKERLSNIARKKEVYGIKNIGNTQYTANVAASHDQLWDLRRTTPFADEENFVGFHDDVKLLEAHIFSSEKGCSVISITGMDGLGKTALARKIYNTNKYKFELHARVCVSQDWNTRDLFRRIIKSLKKLTYDELKMLEKMNDINNMKRYLHELLNDKVYLVVIDDMWDDEALEFLKSALPDNQNQSRVIITTRNEFVAELSDQSHKLRHLRADESWELFCKNAFSNQNGACPQDLEKVGLEMVEKCDGLPLAIIVLGGFLSRNSPNEWHVIKKHIWRALLDTSIHISALLDLSYNDLSHELKYCFLYLGIFPEDYEIGTEKLVQLWIAEDLIPQSEGVVLTELAQSYIKELSARSLIQLITPANTLNPKYRVHGLLRDFATNNAKELNFFHIYEESMNPAIVPFSTKRIAFRSGFERYMATDDHSYSQVHTLSFLNYFGVLDDGDATKLLTLINTKFKSLRVLDLDGVRIVTAQSKLKFLESMEKLVDLKYLGLSEIEIDMLPESVDNLQALQAVDVLSKTDEGIAYAASQDQLRDLRRPTSLDNAKELGVFNSHKATLPTSTSRIARHSGLEESFLDDPFQTRKAEDDNKAAMISEAREKIPLLETAVSELLEAVKDAKKDISSFKPILERLESTFTIITPCLEEIGLSNQSETGTTTDLDVLIRDGKKLVVECSQISCHDIDKKCQYWIRLCDLDYDLLRYFVSVLQVKEYKKMKRVQIVLKKLRLQQGQAYEAYDFDLENFKEESVVETKDEEAISNNPSDYCGKTAMTREDRVREALSTIEDGNKRAVRNHVDTLQIQSRNDLVCTKIFLYNATGDTVTLVGTKNSLWKYWSEPYPSQIENGQWGGFLRVNRFASEGAVVYRGKNLKDKYYDWMFSWRNSSRFQRTGLSSSNILPGDREPSLGADGKNLKCGEPSLPGDRECVFTEIHEADVHYKQDLLTYRQNDLSNRSNKEHKAIWKGCSSSVTIETGTTDVVEAILTLQLD